MRPRPGVRRGDRCGIALAMARFMGAKHWTVNGAAELWSAIIDGRWSLVDQFDHDGLRHFIARENPASARRLSPRERQVAGRASLGHSNKQIAYELGLRSSTVATHLGAAARKLGLASRQTLVASWRALSGGEEDASVERFEIGRLAHAVVRLSAAPLPVTLTPSEREIATAVLSGGSNRAIARGRGVSVRTVANQLASIYRKLGVGSRADLAARFARGRAR